MFKKIVLGSLLIGLIAILVAGAVIRTNARAENGAANGGGQHGRNVAAAQVTGEHAIAQGRGGRWAQTEPAAPGATVGRGGFGQQAAGNATAPQIAAAPANWQTVSGHVVSVASDLVEIETASGATIPFEGQPLRYALTQGFILKLGDAVTVSGYDEDGEFKIGQATNLTTGASVMLRDATGRSGWSGAGRGRNR